MEAEKLHALIMIGRPPEELGFLTAKRGIEMLTIGNKPLIQITFEELFDVGIRSVTIVSADTSMQLNGFVQNGLRWGLSVEHVLTSALTDEVFQNLGAGLTKIAVRGDMLRPFGVLEEALRRRMSQNTADIYTALGIAVSCPDRASLRLIEWSQVAATCQLSPCLLSDPAMYHHANMMAVKGDLPGIRSAGRPAPDDIIVGKGSSVLSSHAPAKTVVIGSHCLIEHGVSLGKNVIIGNNCIIDSGATLENCVVLEGSYIGRGTIIRDKIVDRQNVYCTQRKLHAEIDDRRIFARAS
jgi:NDP-sugar pyrophosphorylase family protein